MDELLAGLGIILATGIFLAFQSFQKHFGPERSLNEEILTLSSQLHLTEQKLANSEDRYLEFKKGVYKLSRKGLDSEIAGEIRNLARLPASEDLGKETQIELQWRLGSRSFEREEYDKSIRHLQMYLEMAPDGVQSALAHVYIVNSWLNLNESDKAVSQLQSMLNMYPDRRETGEALLLVAEDLIKNGKYDKADEFIETVLVAFPKDVALVAKAHKLQKEMEP